ncbi:hypothetical protein ACP4OV_031645 [Aristida adscensionis]
MAAKAYYKYKAELLIKDYLLADSYVPVHCCAGGFSDVQIASYDHHAHNQFSLLQRLWVLLQRCERLNGTTGLFSDQLDGPVTFRSSHLSNLTLGSLLGTFIADLAMILWFYPSLGGREYVIHHMLSLVSVAYAMLSGEGQLYTYMVLISETTTPGINLRWFLDIAGMKHSKAYTVNGVAMFVTWLVARIILFIYLFYHIFIHYEQG